MNHAYPITTSASEFDRLRDVTEENALRQAGVFRAMGLRFAALRVLAAAARRQPTPALRSVWTACQRELAHQEAVRCGKASAFRQAAAGEPDAPADEPSDPPERSAGSLLDDLENLSDEEFERRLSERRGPS